MKAVIPEGELTPGAPGSLSGAIQPGQDRLASVRDEPIVDGAGGKALEVAHDGVKIGRGGDQVHMVGHDDQGEELETLVGAAES
jgi:hypothetical protein